MSSDHSECLATGSTLSPISLTPRLSNSGLSLASAPSSVVQTGVKSFGCENSSAQLVPIQSWNLILPSVVSASKSGATEPICRAISTSYGLATDEIAGVPALEMLIADPFLQITPNCLLVGQAAKHPLAKAEARCQRYHNE